MDHQRLVTIKSLDGYDPDPLRRAVLELLQQDPGLPELLAGLGPGGLVVVKPNWIESGHTHRRREWEALITHPEVVLATVETLAELMGNRGTICICDAPNTSADFSAIVGRGALEQRLEQLRRRFDGMTLELLDLRRQVWVTREDVVVERRDNPHDPRGYVRLDLGRRSSLHGHRGEGRYYGADYDTRVVNDHHRGQVHEYLLAGTAVACDLFVNLPKLKTHRKTGITCCLKNLVGINGDKNWLPHHTEGDPASGGDAFPDRTPVRKLETQIKHSLFRLALTSPLLGTWLLRKIRRLGKSVLGDSSRVVRNGNWEGNDTCWRMVLDLNRALLYGDLDQSWRSPAMSRPYFAIVDGIIAGEGNGPTEPDPVACGVLVGGSNPAAVDLVACRLMDIDPGRIPLVARAFGPHPLPIAGFDPAEVRVSDQRRGAVIAEAEVAPTAHGRFRPHFGWPGLDG